MTTYKEFLEKLEIISEDEFNKMLCLFPEDLDISNYSFDDLYSDDYGDIDQVATSIINNILLEDFSYSWCDSVNVTNKSLELNDVQDLRDLEEIVNGPLCEWNIVNYEDLKKSILEDESEDKEDITRNKILSYIQTFDSENLNKVLDYVKSI